MILDINAIKLMSDEDLLTYIGEMNNKRAVFTIEEIQLPAELGEDNNLDITDTRLYEYMNTDFETSTFAFPVFDESKDDFYKDPALKKGVVLLPPGGGFTKVGYDLDKKMLGVVVVELYTGLLRPIDNDLRHLRLDKKTSDYRHYYYSYEEEKYLQFTLKKVKDPKKKKENQEKIDEYKRRLEIDQYVRWRFKNYIKNFYKYFKNETYNKFFETHTELKKFMSYFKSYRTFLIDVIKVLEIKLILEDIEQQQFLMLMRKVRELEGLIKKMNDKTKDFLATNEVEVQKALKKEGDINFTDSYWTGTTIEAGNTVDKEEARKIYNNLRNVRKELEHFVTTNDEEIESDVKGYIYLEQTKDMLFPNIAQLFSREFRTKTALSKNKIEKREKDIIENVKNGGLITEDTEENFHLDMSIFKEEELLQLNNENIKKDTKRIVIVNACNRNQLSKAERGIYIEQLLGKKEKNA